MPDPEVGKKAKDDQDKDIASKLAGKTLKRKNFKKLQLSSTTPPSSSPRQFQLDKGTGSAGSQRTANSSSVSSLRLQEEKRVDNVASSLGSLDLGVHFKLDLRPEDLETVADLGHGNGGVVTKVLHVPTNQFMAKKVIHVETKPIKRKQIVRELHIMHECESEHIVSYHGAFARETDVVMCMEYMNCGSLDRISKLSGPILEDIIGKITLAVLEGLTYLYAKHRIIHRDVKPSNVLVNSEGQIKLCDFGVSGELINSIADTFVGTSTYMSPERIQGAAYSVKSDVWSLGITVLELAIGKFPFDSNNMGAHPVGILDLLQRIVNEPPPTLPEDRDFTPAFRNFIAKCLYKESQRPTPTQLLEDEFILKAKATDLPLKAWAQKFKIN